MKIQAKTRKRLSIALVCCMVMSLAVGSLALFTDRFQHEETFTAGTLTLDLVQNWKGDNAIFATTDRPGMVPGDGLDIHYTLKNTGNMDAKIREDFVITAPAAMNATTPEFALYKAADVTVKDGVADVGTASPLAFTLSADKTQMQVHIDNATVIAGKGEAKSAYVLVFNKNSGNEFQGGNLTIDYVAQALQDHNTGAPTWDTILNQTVTIGGTSISAVESVAEAG